MERCAGRRLPRFGVFGPVGKIVIYEIGIIQQQPAQTRKALETAGTAESILYNKIKNEL